MPPEPKITSISNGESELPANVVVSDVREETKHLKEDNSSNNNNEEHIEKAVLAGESPELEMALPIENDTYNEKKHISEIDVIPSYLESAFAKHNTPNDQNETLDSDLSKLAPLAKPRMAESKKVIAKKSEFNIFGWLKKPKK
jgi:hypothetical protein